MNDETLEQEQSRAADLVRARTRSEREKKTENSPNSSSSRNSKQISLIQGGFMAAFLFIIDIIKYLLAFTIIIPIALWLLEIAIIIIWLSGKGQRFWDIIKGNWKSFALSGGVLALMITARSRLEKMPGGKVLSKI